MSLSAQILAFFPTGIATNDRIRDSIAKMKIRTDLPIESKDVIMKTLW